MLGFKCTLRINKEPKSHTISRFDLHTTHHHSIPTTFFQKSGPPKRADHPKERSDGRETGGGLSPTGVQLISNLQEKKMLGENSQVMALEDNGDRIKDLQKKIEQLTKDSAATTDVNKKIKLLEEKDRLRERLLEERDRLRERLLEERDRLLEMEMQSTVEHFSFSS
jgi:vacuolar-type H+-ATPase subunit I/STV1